MSKVEFIDKAISWAESKGFYDIKVSKEGYEEPKSFQSKDSELLVAPDLSFSSPRGGQHYCVIALKTDDTESLVTSWKLLSTIANIKSGKLHLLAPRGHKSFTDNIIETYNFSAEIHSI